jgi:multidrug efflux system membrane fusion protein
LLTAAFTSPISGKVGQALVTKGNIANSTSGNSLLTTVVAVDPMYVEFNVNERALLNYQKILSENAAKAAKDGKDTKDAKDSKDSKKDKKAEEAKQEQDSKPEIPVELARLSDTGFPFKGMIDFVDNRVDKNTGSVKVRARFDNPKGPSGGRQLTAGLFARIRVSIAEPYPATLVADRAILTDQSLKYVLVVDKSKKNTVERVDVTVSNRVQPGGLVPVLSGLKGDEWIIVEGVNRARPGIVVNPKEAPMPGQTVDAK